jgi:putative phosphoesterase
MRIAVLADTHDRLPAAVVEAIANADQIWHLGDVCAPETLAPLRKKGMPVLTVVHGNCDACVDWPMTADLQIAGWSVRLIHIAPRVAPNVFDIVLH